MEQISKTIIVEYKYDTEEERKRHVEHMESQGYEWSGQVQKSDDHIMAKERNYYWYGKFYKQL